MLIILILAGSAAPVYAATCTGNYPENGAMTFQLPASITVEPDVSVGTVIYEGSIESGQIDMDCQDTGNKYKGYAVLTDADARNGVLEGVYQTSIPGIGIRMAEAEERTPTFTSEDIVTPMHFYSYGASGWNSIHTKYHASMQLVVTGDVEDGYLDTSRLTAQEKWGNDVIAQILVSPTSIHIQTNTCNLEDKNIYVPLKTINVDNFDSQFSEVLTDNSFKIEISDCRAGTQIDYKFNSAGSTGVTDGNILAIASGDSSASGVGIQILDTNNNVLSFDQTYTAVSSTSANEVAEIPLKARYAKTGNVKAGKVDAVATFEVFYR
ncbi:fimbrial protein [Citrobacter freundii]|nr:fimbrial protein [Citrobacter freundii]EJG2189758.1 fimbrial protein [Citrobacter freundii]EJH9547773.1 fimbrial protein [Citrobacter freundii]EJO6483029.1 fimbrial protein [Citrobacter freundii]EKW5686129.1 fimbrial protein [Citrobacter freundii]